MRPSPWRRLLRHLRPYRPQIVKGFACAVVASGFGLGTPWVIKYTIDDLVAGVTTAKVRGYALVLLLNAAAAGSFRYLNRRFLMNVSRQIESHIRRELFAHLLRLQPSYFQRTRVGDLMARATSDVNAVRLMLGPAVTFLSTETITFVAGVALMVSIDPWLSAVALLALPLVTVTAKSLGRRIHDGFGLVQARFSDMSSIVHQSLTGVRVVRAYRQEAFEIDRFDRANDEYVRQSRSLITQQAMYLPTVALLMGIGALGVLWLGAHRVIRGHMTLGELVAFQAYLTMMTWPTVSFGWINGSVQRGLASWGRLLQVLDTEPIVVPAASDHVGHAAAHTIEFRHLTFGFGHRTVLRDVCATIPAARTTAIVGPTGSGKSTLLALLARLNDPPEATVFVGGVDVCRLPASVLRGAMAFATQEPCLFSGTIAENIAYGAGGEPVSQERVELAAAAAGLGADLPAFPDGYDTAIGERGITLSGGEKQRVAIARAIVSDAPVLVLDDALSAVDAATEVRILRGLRSLPGRTLILVSHRVPVVRAADQILVLDEGQIVERGTHHELVQRAGLYAALDRQQQLKADLV